MNRTYIGLAIAVIVVVLGIAFYPQQAQEQQLESSSLLPTTSVVPTVATSTPAASTPSTNVSFPSIPALTNYVLNGKDFTVGQVLARTATYTRYFITYTSDDLTISGIMNVPHGDGPFPVLMLNHGYIDPAIYTNGRGLKREQDYFASRGYVVIHSDYRNHATSSKDENSEKNFRLGYAIDVMNGIHALKASNLPYINKEHIGMLGHSMGGGVTLNIITSKPDLIQAAVLFAPVSGDVRDNFERWTKTRPEVANSIIETYGSPEQNPSFYDNVSPINFLSTISVPILNHHGTADDSVPIEWSQKLQTALEKAGKNSTLHVYDGQPHEFTTAWSTVMKRSIDFFDSNLKS